MNPLVLAAIPAFLGSLILMHQGGGATRTQVIEQALVFAVSGMLCAALSRKQVVLTGAIQNALLALTVLALLAPLALTPGDGPHRWVGAGGIRLYIASAVLPCAVLLLAHRFGQVGQGATHLVWPVAALIAMAAALAAQPDASQATAFSLAFAPFLRRGTLPLFTRAGAGLALAGVIWIAWLRPDPLKPVAYVEGVFALALAVSPFALALALLFLALPLFVLLLRRTAGVSWNRSVALPVAIYYITLGFFGYRQLTPVPLLGFGPGPILGYFGMVTVLAWLSSAPARQPEG